LEGLKVFGVSKDDQVREGMNGNGGVSKVVEEEGGLLEKVDVVQSHLLECEWSNLMVEMTLSQWDWKVSRRSKMVPR